jgi:hypothetical protein
MGLLQPSKPMALEVNLVTFMRDEILSEMHGIVRRLLPGAAEISCEVADDLASNKTLLVLRVRLADTEATRAITSSVDDLHRRMHAAGAANEQLSLAMNLLAERFTLMAHRMVDSFKREDDRVAWDLTHVKASVMQALGDALDELEQEVDAHGG